MVSITDEYMREHLQKTKSYTIVILHKTPKRETDPLADKIIWELDAETFSSAETANYQLFAPSEMRAMLAESEYSRAILKRQGR